MKYILTKDGIYTLITKDEPIYELNGKKYYCVEEQISSFSEDDVINQADTIEELIDAYFIVSKKEDNNWCVTKEKTTAEIYNKSNYGYCVYGAIKIKENNQYIFKSVTKPMDEEGNLELL